MRKLYWKKGFLLLVAALACAICTEASAVHLVPDLSQTGSITLTMRDSNENAVLGGGLTLYRVGDVLVSDGNYSFTLSEDFSSSGFTLDDIGSPELAAELETYAENTGLTGTTTSVSSDGTVTFSDLKLGLYLIAQNDAVSGYYAVSPFLVSVPIRSGDVYLYDIDATPKVELLVETPQSPEPAPTDPTLPQTGQLNWPVPVLAITGMLLFSLGWAFYVKKGKTNHAA